MNAISCPRGLFASIPEVFGNAARRADKREAGTSGRDFGNTAGTAPPDVVVSRAQRLRPWRASCSTPAPRAPLPSS